MDPLEELMSTNFYAYAFETAKRLSAKLEYINEELK